MRSAMLFAGALASCALIAAPASSQAPPRSEFVTLGTMGGPAQSTTRAQPANLLRVEDRFVLIDVGDGAVEQLARAGVDMRGVDTIFISHLHFDHTGGLFAFLGRRFQGRDATNVTIFGPPGTRRMVDGLVAAMAPANEIGAGFGETRRAPISDRIRVEEVSNGSRVEIGAVVVTAASNAHYSYPNGSAEAAARQSLAFRFDLPDRSIVYTGDTGPSANVERLARGADLLVSEVIDVEAMMAALRRARPEPSAQALVAIEQHFREHHLTPEEAGDMARLADVRELVLTHLSIADTPPEQIRSRAAARFSGEIVVARDLQSF